MASPSFTNKFKSKLGNLARSRKGLFLMTLICFLEPIFLPMIPELVVSPMLLARRQERAKILFCALMGTILGALFTYSLGYFLGKVLISWLMAFSLDEIYYSGLEYLDKYGTFLPFIISLTPFPLKMVTWTCGIARFNVLIYAAGISFGRLLRYSTVFLLSGKKKLSSEASSGEISPLLSSSTSKGV